METYTSIPEAAKDLSTHHQTIRRLIFAGRIKAEKIPGPYGAFYKLLSSKEEIKKALEQFRAENPSKTSPRKRQPRPNGTGEIFDRKDLWSPAEVAKICHVATSTVYNAVKELKITKLQVNASEYLITKADAKRVWDLHVPKPVVRVVLNEDASMERIFTAIGKLRASFEDELAELRTQLNTMQTKIDFIHKELTGGK